SDQMHIAPFDQYRRAIAGLDQVDSENLAEIFAHACNSLGIPARIVQMEHTIFSSPDLVVEAAPPHASVEIFDSVGNRWVFLDLSLGLLGVEDAGIGLVNSARLSRAAINPIAANTLKAWIYDPAARLLAVPFSNSSAGTFLSGYFQLGPYLRFRRNDP